MMVVKPPIPIPLNNRAAKISPVYGRNEKEERRTRSHTLVVRFGWKGNQTKTKDNLAYCSFVVSVARIIFCGHHVLEWEHKERTYRKRIQLPATLKWQQI